MMDKQEYSGNGQAVISDPLADIFIGRQPIYDRNMNVVAYELLYRDSNANRANFSDPDQATTRVILNAFVEMGLENIIGKHKAFVNITRNFFLQKYPFPLSANQLVIEVLEETVADQSLIQSLKDLSQRGFEIALDDVAYPIPPRELLRIANILKIDLIQVKVENLKPYLFHFRDYGVKLLAEKVETKAEFDTCYRCGFAFFQGYFLSKPNIIRGRQISSSHLVLLQLLGKLQQPNFDYAQLENLVSQDAVLGYKLLRLTNSVYYSLETEVKSLRQAMTLLGAEKIRSWLTLILIAEKQDKPRELTILAMIRARMCELLARAVNAGQADSYFLVGLFSTLDAIMDMPLEQITSAIRLTDEVKRALLEGSGPMGQALRCVLAYERMVWEEVTFYHLNTNQIRDIYLETLQWVEVLRVNLNLT